MSYAKGKLWFGPAGLQCDRCRSIASGEWDFGAKVGDPCVNGGCVVRQWETAMYERGLYCSAYLRQMADRIGLPYEVAPLPDGEYAREFGDFYENLAAYPGWLGELYVAAQRMYYRDGAITPDGHARVEHVARLLANDPVAQQLIASHPESVQALLRIV